MNKINFKRVLIFLLFLLLLVGIGYYILNIRIKNIYIYNNYLVTDQEVIDYSNLRNYPKYFFKTNYSIKKDLLRNTFIKDAKIKKKKLREVHICVEEYKPLFFYNGKVILNNKKEIFLNISLPILVNKVEEPYYSLLVDKMDIIDEKIKNEISEIKYDPTNIDDERILLIMNDGNNVYLTLETFEKINDYDAIVMQVECKKGTLFLDYGDYFKCK